MLVEHHDELEAIKALPFPTPETAHVSSRFESGFLNYSLMSTTGMATATVAKA